MIGLMAVFGHIHIVVHTAASAQKRSTPADQPCLYAPALALHGLHIMKLCDLVGHVYRVGVIALMRVLMGMRVLEGFMIVQMVVQELPDDEPVILRDLVLIQPGLEQAVRAQGERFFEMMLRREKILPETSRTVGLDRPRSAP